MTMNDEKIIELEQGWEFIQKGITKLKKILEGYPEPQFSSEDYMILYTTIFSMCTQKPPHDYSQQMYDRYKEAFDEYITSTVLPSLREKHDEYMLRELVKRWSNHKVMVTWLSRFFHYLDRYFIAQKTLPPLNEVGLACFRDQVYLEINGKVRDAVISLIDQEREGELIDQALLKNVLDIFVEIGMGSMEYYENDFETAVLKDTAAYYSRNASIWIREDSCPDCMLKAAEECLRLEKDRVSHYLHSSSEQRLLEKVQHELLFVYASQLLEKEHSGCRALPRDDKVEDLSRMYRLFSKINKGLDPVSQIFKQHVTAEGTTLVKQAEDAASNKKDFHVGALEKFVEEAGVPVITTFNNDRNNHPFVIKFFNSPNAKAMLFLNFSSESFEAFKSKYHHTAEHYKGSGISFLIGDIDASQGAFQFFGLKEDQVPLIIIQTEDGQKYLKANLEPDHIAPWLKEYTDGSLKPFKKSEPIPEVNNEPVKVVVADTLHEMLNSGKNVLLEFYAPWCGHCKKPAPILDEVAVSVGSDPDVVIAKIDATANDIPGDTFDVKGYPTIYFSSPNGSIMQYEGDRSKEDIIEFIQKNKHTVAQPDPVKDEL